MKKTFTIFFAMFLIGLTCCATTSVVESSVKDLLSNLSPTTRENILILPVENYSADVSINAATIYSDITKLVLLDKRFNIVDRLSLDRILEEHKFSMTGITSPESAVKIGNIISAHLILTTRIEQGIIEHKLIKVETSEIIAYEFKKIGEKQEHGSVTSANQPEIRTGWITSDKYQSYFDSKLKIGYFPVEVQGRNFNGWAQYYGVYRLNKTGIHWYTHHGLTKNQFKQRLAELDRKGFKVVYQSTFFDGTGTERFNAIWHLQ